MKNESRTKLFLVDDDAVYLKLLEVEFHQHTDFAVETFATGELCMERLRSETPDIIVLDYHLDGIEKTAMNGLYFIEGFQAVHRCFLNPIQMIIQDYYVGGFRT